MAAVARSSYGAATDPPPSAPLPYNNAPSAAFTTVAELRALAKQNTKQAIKGASPLTCVSLTQKLADDAQLCEDSGDFSGAFFKYIQASNVLQYILESHDFKQEIPHGKRGVLYHRVEDLQKFVSNTMMPKAIKVEAKLKELEAGRASQNSSHDASSASPPSSSDGPNERPGGSIMDRLRSLQGAGMSVDVPKRMSRDFTTTPISQHRSSPSVNGVALPQSPPSIPMTSLTPSTIPTSPPPSRPNFDLSTAPLVPTAVQPPHASPSQHPLKPSPSSISAISFSTSPPTPTDSTRHNFDHLPTPTVSQFTSTFPALDDFDSGFTLPSVPSLPPSTSSSLSPLPSVPTNRVGVRPLPPPPIPPGDLRGGPPAGSPRHSPRTFPSLSIDQHQRPSSTPIPTVPALTTQTTPNNISPTPPHLTDLSSPPPKPVASFYQHPVTPLPKPFIPVTNSVEPRKLFEWRQGGIRPLILDVRTREEFDAAHIKIDEIVCIEPTIVTRAGISSVKIEEAMIISPPEELTLFKNREKFDIVVLTDYSSTSFGSSDSPLSSLNGAIYTTEFTKVLKRPPILLIGGLKAWSRDVGEDQVISARGQVSLPASTHSTGTNGDNTGGSRSSIDASGRPRSAVNGATSANRESPRLPRVDEQRVSPPMDPASYKPNDTSEGIRALRRPPHVRPGSMSHFTSHVRDGAEVMSVASASSPSIAMTLPSAAISTTSIRYPEAAATPSSSSSPPPNMYRGVDGTMASAPSPISSPMTRRKTEYYEQSQHAYSGSITSRPGPIDYPMLSSPSAAQQSVLRPPPPAAAPSLERQDQRPLVQSQAVATRFTMQPPLIASDYPVTYWADEEVGITGLKNLGNTCYMNSTLQCLSATIPFARFFREGRWKTAINTLNPLGTKGALAMAFDHILRQMWHPESTYFSPAPFRKSVCHFAGQFSGSDQHDSQEFLSFLLDGLHEDLNRVLYRPPPQQDSPEREAALEAMPHQIASAQEWKNYRMRNDSIVVDYFQGQFRNRLQCLHCGKTSTTYNSFMYLSLPIPTGRGITKVSLQMCLDAFVKEEIMEKSDAWNCPQCKTLRKATKQLSLSRMPPVLLIHLKRFSAKGPFTDKLETLVDFPLRGLDLTNYLPPPLPPGVDKTQLYGGQQPHLDDPRSQMPPYKYDLYGVTNHFGSLSSGHYTAFIASKGKWLYCDDTRITSAENREIVGRPAYVLFYKRVRS